MKNSKRISIRHTPLGQQGVAMIEFALALPVLLLLMVGLVELSNYAQFREKMDGAAVQMADLIGQANNAGAQELESILGAFDEMVQPYAMSDAIITVTFIMQPGAGCDPLAVWQYTKPETTTETRSLLAPVVGEKADISAITVDTTDHILAIEIFATYTPIFGGFELFNLEDNYSRAYTHTRYGAFLLDPVTEELIDVPCKNS